MENAQSYFEEPEDRVQWATATTEIWGGKHQKRRKTPEKEKARKKEPQIL